LSINTFAAAAEVPDVYLRISAGLPAGARASTRIEFQIHESVEDSPWGSTIGRGEVLNRFVLENAGLEAMAPSLYMIPKGAWDTMVWRSSSSSATGEVDAFLAGRPVKQVSTSSSSSDVIFELLGSRSINYIEIQWDEGLNPLVEKKDPAGLGAATRLS
jgi:hypothetical protein